MTNNYNFEHKIFINPMIKAAVLIVTSICSVMTASADIADDIISRKRLEKAAMSSVAREDSIYLSIATGFDFKHIDADSILRLGEYHISHPRLAERIYKLALSEVNAQVLGELGRLYVFSPILKKKEDGRLLLEEASKQGYSKANLYLAMDDFYEKNYDMAWSSLSQLDCTDYAPGLNALGYMKLNGWGTETNEQKGFELILEATKKGMPLALRTLPMLYEKGKGCNVNYEEAFIWYYISGDLGDDVARVMLHLPMLQDLSNSKDANVAKAYTMLKFLENLKKDDNFAESELYGGFKSSLNNSFQTSKTNPILNFYLGSIYYNGDFVDKNYEKAFSFYKAVIDNDNMAKLFRSMAAYRLGIMYRYGRGILKDESLADFYTRLAASLGNQKAYDLINHFSNGNL